MSGITLISLKRRLFRRLLCGSVLLILLGLMDLWHVFLRRDPVPTTKPYLKILCRKSTKKNSTESPIPQIIHQTWKSPTVSSVFEPWIKSCLEQNPDWEYWFWTDKEMRDLVEEKYPQLLKMYDNYPSNIYRADVFRILAVHQYGGIYTDLDFECLQPFRKAIGEQSCFFSTEPEGHAQFQSPVNGPLVSNGLFGCIPNHPFFTFFIHNLQHNSRKGVLWATGPFLLSHLHKAFSSKRFRFTSGNGFDVPLSEPEIFQPTIDSIKVNKIRKTCQNDKQVNSSERGKQVCEKVLDKDFQNEPTNRSVTNHHWSHTWTGQRFDRLSDRLTNKQYFNIRELNDLRND